MLLASRFADRQCRAASAELWRDYRRIVTEFVRAANALQAGTRDENQRREIDHVVALVDGPPRVFPRRPLAPVRCGQKSPGSPWQRLRRETAERLYRLAGAAYRSGDLHLCYEALCQILVVDPDHEPTRHLFGYRCRGGMWHTRFTLRQERLGLTWHPRWGWVTKAMVPRLEAGKRLVRGRWVDRTRAETLLGSWANAYTIETEHYRIQSTADLEETVRLAVHLEQVHAVFYRLFASYLPPDDQLRSVFGRALSAKVRRRVRATRQRRLLVACYRDRTQFQQAIARFPIPGKDVATGLYVPRQRRVYCYAEPSIQGGWIPATLHEATHQLFVESRSDVTLSGTRGNYWVIEGLASYMESLELQPDRVLLGRWDTPRLKLARDRLVLEHRYVKLAKLVRLDEQTFSRGDTALLYGQAALVCHFFLHGAEGRYRDAFVEYVARVFSGQADEETLAELTGRSYEQLDREIVVHAARKDW